MKHIIRFRTGWWILHIGAGLLLLWLGHVISF